ncbi:MAG: hypothetical protein A3F16_08275 [Deltaproteobacteria bacterium RIFCSPHIGHO2_12_FULL_43_9]|nr:MAG: hypothetical protein A3F16_08275 [Deltaproteobacteria bacterium RIFCSPHIGHO2_12_FULL_43_9]
MSQHKNLQTDEVGLCLKFWVVLVLSILPMANHGYAEEQITIIERESQMGFWPCSSCHTGNFKGLGDPNNQHQLTFKHMENVNECLFCHSFKNPERLHLEDGTTITFNESYRLCTLCHGEIYREWKVGIHGLQTGYWKGPKTRRNCTQCHNAHAPKFPPMEALPNPVDYPNKPAEGKH